jgi:hypothetical protein
VTIHNDTGPSEKRISGAACFLCNKGGAKAARIRVEVAGQVVADETVALCEDCAADRYRVIETTKRRSDHAYQK